MTEITLNGRKIPMIYTVWEMKQAQEEIAPIYKLASLLSGRNPDDDKDSTWYGGKAHLDALGKMICILGNAGLEEAGEEPDLTFKKVLRAMKPSQIVSFTNACMDAMAEGMISEIPDSKEGPVDVTLEELKKNGSPEG